MKNIGIGKKVICGVIAGSLLISGVIFAYADNSNNSTAANTNGSKKIAFMRGYKADAAHLGSSFLDQMVKEGTLTQEKADAIKNYLKQKMADRKKLTKEELKAQKGTERVNMLDQMVKDGVITQTEANAIKAKKQQLMEEKKQQVEQERITKLNSLVEKGIINQDQLNKLNEYMNAAKQERLQTMEKIKGMTAEERKAYFKDNKPVRTNVLQKMTDDKVITQDQAKQIKEALFGNYKQHFKGNRQHGESGKTKQ